MSSNRRNFVKNLAIVTTATQIPVTRLWSQHSDVTQGLNVSIFSKHLQFLDYKRTGQIAAELGFDGVDLTVRPKGHVLPENVSVDLPAAVKDIKQGGSDCRLITTSIESIDQPYDVDILRAASSSGVKYYRTHWYKYQKGIPLVDSLKQYQSQLERLSLLNERLDIVGCYQNHAGTNVGASFWEIHQLLQRTKKEYFGTQYDIRHATIEGGYSWVNGFELLKDRIKVIVLKDFKWGKVDGTWKAINVPIGDGMVDFKKYFRLLKKNNLNPPVSLHLEYPLGGAEKGKYEIKIDPSIVYDAMRKDLNAIRTLWKDA